MNQSQCQHKYIGKNVPRIDAFDKVTGKAKFIGDIKMPGMLYGKILRSPIAHGIIKNIDTSKARELAGVRAVITYKDVPQNSYSCCGHPYPEDTPKDCRILDKKVRYVGDPVAAVAADTLEIAEKALKLIEIEYQELPAYFTPEDSLKEGAVEIHDGSKNILGNTSYSVGDVDAAFDEAKYVFEDEFKTPIIAHTPIENHVSIAYIDTDGRLVIHSSNQSPSTLRRIVAGAFGMSIGKVRVIKTYVGGAFGGKQEPVQEPINAALAFATAKPVLLEYSREETIAATRTRHSMNIKLKTGVTAEGKIIAREIKIISNNGAYSSHGHNVVLNAGGQFPALYPTPNIRFSAITVYTNIPIAGAMRGYGIPQYNIAVESHIDNIAYKLSMDPIEFRQKNLCKEGDYNEANHIKINTCGLPEIIEEGKKRIKWNENRSKFSSLNLASQNKKKKGIGVACFSIGETCYPFNTELSGARVMMNEDCSATLFIGCSDIGQGTNTVMKQIAAEALGIPIEWIVVKAVDTDICPFDLGAYASRQTYVSGLAVKKAALLCKKDILEAASKILACNVQKLETEDGWIINKSTEKKLIEMSEVTMNAFYDVKNPITITHEAYASPQCNALAFGATFAEIEVDTSTGKVDVEKLVSVMDSGTIINPLLAQSQVIGGNVMSLGYGLMEQMLIDNKTGKVLNPNLLDYKMPTMADVPPIEVVFIETDDPSSAYGNKALGEAPTVTTAPAIRNAVLNATGVMINENPLTPERILMKLKESKDFK